MPWGPKSIKPPAEQKRRKFDPEKLQLPYEWIERIVTFDYGRHEGDGLFWMSKRQQEKFAAFQKEVRSLARSGEWGDYATVEVDSEIQGIIEDMLGITFDALNTCYNCGVEFSDLLTLDSHEETCGL